MKLLYITSLSGRRINGFMRSAILAAKQLNIDFTLACNMTLADKAGYAQDCNEYGIRAVHIDFDRKPLGRDNRMAYHQLLELMEQERFDAIHCNTPIGGLLGRLCAKKAGIPHVIYMAHGFHFWKGAPLKNWLLYYPVERLLAHDTDILITINQEDYQCAKTFHLRKAGKAVYIPGVGINLNKFAVSEEERRRQSEVLRRELSIPKEDKIFITVGEINRNKGQETALCAFAKAGLSHWRYLVCGDGEQKKRMQSLANELGIADRVYFLGFRSDVPSLLAGSDCFVFTSYREGLPAALMEAMASGLPCIATRIRGLVDLMPEKELLFQPGNVDALSVLLKRAYERSDWKPEIQKNLDALQKYDIHNVIDQFCALYQEIQSC